MYILAFGDIVCSSWMWVSFIKGWHQNSYLKMILWWIILVLLLVHKHIGLVWLLLEPYLIIIPTPFSFIELSCMYNSFFTYAYAFVVVCRTFPRNKLHTLFMTVLLSMIYLFSVLLLLLHRYQFVWGAIKLKKNS